MRHIYYNEELVVIPQGGLQIVDENNVGDLPDKYAGPGTGLIAVGFIFAVCKVPSHADDTSPAPPPLPCSPCSPTISRHRS